MTPLRLSLVVLLAACDPSPAPMTGPDGAVAADEPPTPDLPVTADVGADALPDLLPSDVGADAPPDRAAPDVAADTSPVDAAPDATDGGAPAGEAVWEAASTGFTLRASGGFPLPPLPGGCARNDHTYTYEVATGALGHAGCYGGRTVADAVVLDAPTRAMVVAQVAALRTTSDLGCGADFPDLVLTVAGAGGGPRAFNGSYYGGCPARMLAPPFVAGRALEFLGAFLANTIATCPGGDAGAEVHCAAADAGASDGG